MNMNTILDYLTALEQNNNKEWYHAHKAEREAASREFEALIGMLMMELRKTDESIPFVEPKKLTFKTVRDTRFSNDKSPYNPAFRAHIAPKGKLPVPVGYFLMLRPGGRSFLGGGLFADMFKDATRMVRDYIAAHGRDWNKIITAPAFTKYFAVGGTALKKVPQGYDPNHPQGEYLKYKSWYLEYPLTDKQLMDADFVDCAVDIFVRMQAFNGFLNRALKDFQMPPR
jgi:uncharacterized protein (TIGR02453 family)